MSRFRKWGHNDLLTLSQLRQKTITFLAFMCHLSDIAPNKGFNRKQIRFKRDGFMVIQFFGKKTGFSCTSHKVLIKKGTE